MEWSLVRKPWWAVPTLLLIGCATRRGDAFSPTDPEVYRSPPSELPSPPAEDIGALSGPTLDRRAYVRAVLRRNRSIESSRQAWRAAIGRSKTRW
jgi:hypothetical protein